MDVSSPTIAIAATPADRLAGHSAERLADRLAWVVLAMLGVVAALTFRDYGLGWDDFTHAQYGDLLLSLYTSGFHDTRALSFVNLYLYGGGFDMAAALLAKVLPFDLFETRRLARRRDRHCRPRYHLADRPPHRRLRLPDFLRSSCSPPARSTTATCS